MSQYVDRIFLVCQRNKLTNLLITLTLSKHLRVKALSENNFQEFTQKLKDLGLKK
jgi:hypothetical protein